MRAAEIAATVACETLGATWRVRWMDSEPVASFRKNRQPFIFALWHADILPLLWFHRGHPTALLVSAHRDGQMLATAASRWGYRVIHGSSSRHGAVGLRGIIRTLRSGGEAAITPDGPRGPARVVKAGLLAAAQAGANGNGGAMVAADGREIQERTSVPVVPVAAVASTSWVLKSWDRMQIPKPFARVQIAYGPVVTVPPGAAGREAARDQLVRALRVAEEHARS